MHHIASVFRSTKKAGKAASVLHTVITVLCFSESPEVPVKLRCDAESLRNDGNHALGSLPRSSTSLQPKHNTMSQWIPACPDDQWRISWCSWPSQSASEWRLEVCSMLLQVRCTQNTTTCSPQSAVLPLEPPEDACSWAAECNPLPLQLQPQNKYAHKQCDLNTISNLMFPKVLVNSFRYKTVSII